MKRYTQKPQEQLLSLNRLREVERKLDLIAKEFQQKKILDPEKIVLDHFEFMALFKISRRTSQHWRLQKKIEYSLIGGRIYFTLADIQRLLEQHKVRPEICEDLRETMVHAKDAEDTQRTQRKIQLTN